MCKARVSMSELDEIFFGNYSLRSNRFHHTSLCVKLVL